MGATWVLPSVTSLTGRSVYIFEKPGLLTQALFFIIFKIDIIIVSIFLSFLSFLCSANFR